MPSSSAAQPRVVSAADRFVEACSWGDSDALCLVERLVPDKGTGTSIAAVAGVLAALKDGQLGTACAVLVASSLVRASVVGSKSVLIATTRPGNEAAFDAVMALEPPASVRASVLLTEAPSLSPRHRAALEGEDGQLLVDTLAAGLEGGSTWLKQTEALVRTAPADRAPDLLAALVGHASRMGTLPNKVPLVHLMNLAAQLRPAVEVLEPSTPPFRDEVVDTWRADARTPAEWISQWSKWMLAFETLADGESWASLHRHSMPPSAREAFWVVLAARLTSDGIHTVPPPDRVELLAALTRETLTQHRAAEEFKRVPGWPDLGLLGTFAAKDPLNVFLIAWRSHACPTLAALAIADNNDALLTRLVGFGAKLDTRLADGDTVLQNIARHRRNLFWNGTGWPKVGLDWSLCTPKGETLAHLLFQKEPPVDPSQAQQEWGRALQLLQQFSSRLPATVWASPDAAGRTPMAALQAFRDRLDDAESEKVFSNWAARHPDVLVLLESGDLHHALGDTLPAVRPAAPRRRM